MSAFTSIPFFLSCLQHFRCYNSLPLLLTSALRYMVFYVAHLLRVNYDYRK